MLRRSGWPPAVTALLTCLAPAMSAAQSTEVDPRSLMTTPVWLLSRSTAVSQGTGFFYASTSPGGEIETVFLVTNYHVVTGHSPGATAPPRGDAIRIVLHRDPDRLRDVQAVDLPLFDERREPVWIASASSPAADVVLVPIPPAAYERIRLFVFTEAHTEGDIRIRPTSGATLLGYPFGFYDTTHYLPVWKTGHVASEPDVDFEGRPVFLVDVSAFPGMSGAPVLAVANGIYESRAGAMRSGFVLKLLGIFSSMPVARQTRPGDPASGGVDPSQTIDTPLQLGYVWKARVIAEMARAYRPRRRP